MEGQANPPRRSASVTGAALFLLLVSTATSAVLYGTHAVLDTIEREGIGAAPRAIEAFVTLPPGVASELERIEWYRDQLEAAYERTRGRIEMPPAAKFVARHADTVVLWALIGSALTWLGSVGLLLRLNLARTLVIWLLAGTALACVAACALTQTVYDAIVVPFRTGPNIWVTAAMAAVFTSAFLVAALCALFTGKFLVRATRDEFAPSHGQTPDAPVGDSEPVPRGIHVRGSEREFCLTYRWFQRVDVLYLLLGGGAVGVTTIVATMDPALFSQSSIVAVGILGPMTYFMLAAFLNSTRLRVDGTSLHVAVRPLPWLGNRTIPIDRIRQLYCEKRRVPRRRTYRYRLFAVLEGNESVKLLWGLYRAAACLYAERQLERQLGIQDQPLGLPDELRPPS